MNKVMNKCVLFDLDGVLVDACDWHYEALNEALYKICKYKISREDHLKDFNGLPTKVKLLKLAEKNLISLNDIELIENLKQEFTIKIINKFCKKDFSKIDLFKKLKNQNYKIGCVTNSITETAMMMLKLSGIFEYLDLVLTNQNVRFSKPHPEGYIKAMVILQSLPEDTIIVEDSEKGLEAARLTGAKVIKVKDSTEVNENLNL